MDLRSVDDDGWRFIVDCGRSSPECTTSGCTCTIGDIVSLEVDGLFYEAALHNRKH